MKAIREYIMIAIGLLINTLAWNLFLIPHEVAGGGATGIAAIVMYATKGLLPAEVQAFFAMLGMESVGGGIPITVTFFAINAVLLIASVKVLGFQFSIRSIFGVLCLTVWLWIPFRDLYQRFTGEPFPLFEPFMSSILAGLILGIGMGLAFTNNGSSGGTDIIAKIINKYRTITLGRALLFTDVMIICSSGFLPDAGIDKVVYGLVAMTVTSITLDMYINGIRQSVQFFIFSKKYAEIADTITQNAHRGVTVINGQGWYSKEDVKVITVVARKNESTQIFRLIKEIDPNAFISQSAAIGVYGKGFEN
ncbi:MAG: YitT family protein [Paludibacteraceae bacterium]|jgi:uncharacterized membrane-anchored protein YitT (DUF2179 family)|nr:YitT family protein [Paludibacteraceae bacterium]